MKLNKIIIFVFLFINAGINLNAQIQLESIKYDECDKSGDAYNFKPVFKLKWLNNNTLWIETKASSNCIGVYNPRVIQHGPLVCLEFDQFKLDSVFNKIEKISADCNCVYCIVWVIKGISRKSDFILLQNGQISSDQKRKTLNRLLKSYTIEDSEKYFFLLNAIDLNGLRQGIQVSNENNITSWTPYHNDKEIKL